MENSNNSINQVSRRKFLGLTAAAATFAIVSANFRFVNEPWQKRPGKPNSKFGGVQIGATTDI